MIIAIVGMAGSGKSEAASYLSQKLNFGYLRFGKVVEEGAKKLGAVNEANERLFREQIRRELGMKAIAVKAEPFIEELKKKHKNIILDGLYSWEEYEYLKQLYPQLLLLCIHARPTIRYKRLLQRPYRPLASDEARSRDVAELTKLNKGNPIAFSDFLIVNEGIPEKLYRAVDNVIGEINRKDYYQK